MNKFKERHIKLIEGSGGVVTEELFVEKVGVMLTKKSGLTSDASELFSLMNIDTEETEASQHAEFNSRITYLAFKDEPSSSKEYNEKMIKEYGHRSVYNDEIVTFLIAGCSLETMLEFLAHNEATVARLTSSKTNAQDDVLYRVQTKNVSEEFIEAQKNIIQLNERTRMLNRKFIDENNSLEKEIFNIMNFGCKAVSFTITMSVKDWHKTLIGRLSNSGVESEMIEILSYVTDLLHNEYPFFFNTKEEYFAMGNEKKYESK